MRSFADAALSRNQNVPASWEVRESKPLGMSAEDLESQLEDLSRQNDSDDNGKQQEIFQLHNLYLPA